MKQTPKKTLYKNYTLYSCKEGAKDYVKRNKKKENRLMKMHKLNGNYFFEADNIDKLLESNHGLYEIIESDEPRFVYFDCDMKHQCLDIIKEEIYSAFPEAQMNISGSITETKVSYHIVLSNYFFKNVKEQQLLRRWTELKNTLFDPNVYCSDQAFKCVNQQKVIDKSKEKKTSASWDPRVQKIIEGSQDPKDHLVVIKGPIPSTLKNALETLSWLSGDEIIHLKQAKRLSGDKIVRDKELYDEIKNTQGYSKINFLNLFPQTITRQDKYAVMNYMKYETYESEEGGMKLNNKFCFEDFYNWKKKYGKSDLKNKRKWEDSWNKAEDYGIKRTNILYRIKTYLPNIGRDYYEMLYLNDMEFKINRDIKRLYLEPEDYETDKKFVYNIVHMNGGKTQSSIRFMRNFKSVLIVLSRVSLVSSFFSRLEEEYPGKFLHYEKLLASEMNKYKTEALKKEYLKTLNFDYHITTINSLEKTEKKEYDLVLVDEFELLLNSYAGTDFLRESYYNLLIDMFRRSNKVILLDALPSHKSIRMLLNAGLIKNMEDVFIIGSSVKHPVIPVYKLESTAEYIPIVNGEPKIRNKINYKMENNVRKIAQMIADDVLRGEQVYIFWPTKTSDEKYKELVQKMNQEQYVTYIQELIRKKDPNRELRYLVYNSESPKSVKDTLKDVNTHWKDLDIVITGQSITVGVNYEATKFRTAYAFDLNYVCDREIVQTCRRIRKLERVFYVKLSDYNYGKNDTIVAKDHNYEMFIKDVKDEKRGRTFNTIKKSMERGGFKFMNCKSTEEECEQYDVSHIRTVNDDFNEIQFIEDTTNEELLDIGLLVDKINFCKLFSERPEKYKDLWNDKTLAELWQFRRQIKAVHSIYPNIYEKYMGNDFKIREGIKREGIFLILARMLENNGKPQEIYDDVGLNIFINTLYNVCISGDNSSLYNITDEEHNYINKVIYNYNPFITRLSKEKALVKFINIKLGMFFKPEKDATRPKNVIYEINSDYTNVIEKVVNSVCTHIYTQETDECMFIDDEMEIE